MRAQLLIILMTCLSLACDKDDVGIYNELKGQWDWKSTCGGVVGCVNSTPDNHMTIKISETDIVTTVSDKNGTNSTSTAYLRIDKQNQGGNTIYKIKFANGTIWTMTVNKNSLSSDGGFVYSFYTRIF